VLVVTFLSTLLIALEFAIYVGVLLSLVLYLQRTSHPRIINLAPDPERPKRYLNNAVKHELPECPQFKIIRIDGSLFFGAVDHVQSTLHRLSEENMDWKHVLVIGDSINFIDVAGAEMLAQEAQRLRRRGGGLYLCGIKAPVRRVLMRGGYGGIIEEKNFFPKKEIAIGEIFLQLDPDRCRLCQWRIFRECASVEFEGSGVMS
jgi:SulP family sulfate permease